MPCVLNHHIWAFQMGLHRTSAAMIWGMNVIMSTSLKELSRSISAIGHDSQRLGMVHFSWYGNWHQRCYDRHSSSLCGLQLAWIWSRAPAFCACWNKVTIQLLNILQNGEKSNQQMSLGLILMKVKCNMCLMSFGFYLLKLDISENTKPYAWNYTCFKMLSRRRI